MNRTVPLRSSQSLDRPDFEVLLRRFDTDSKRSLEKYENLRRRLKKFFEWNSCFSASEDLADLTMDTVARKPSDFVIHEVVAYCYGVARKILMEFQRRSAREIHLADLPEVHGSVQDFEKSLVNDIDLHKRVDCLNQCLLKLKSEDRDLVLDYYGAYEPTSIPHRQELARKLGVSMNVLWVRVNRIRDKLEKCVESRLGRRTT